MVLVIAHRGASGHLPEHTAAAYRLALELGADAVEPDLVPTADGVLVIRHDVELDDTTDHAGRTTDLTWDELRTVRARERLPELRPDSAAHDGEEGVLRFTELLDLLGFTARSDDEGPPDAVAVAAPPRPVLVAELKTTPGFDLPAMFVRELDGRVPAGLLVVECFEFDTLAATQALGLAATYVLLSETPVDVAALPDWVGGVSYDKSLLLGEGGAALVAAAHDRGLLVFTWTLRPENAFLSDRFRTGEDPASWGDWRGEFGAVLATGVDGVFADHPDLVRSLVDEHA